MSIGWLVKLRFYLRFVDFASQDGGIVAELHFKIFASRLYQYHSTLPPVSVPTECVSICQKHEKSRGRKKEERASSRLQKARLCSSACLTHRPLRIAFNLPCSFRFSKSRQKCYFSRLVTLAPNVWFLCTYRCNYSAKL